MTSKAAKNRRNPTEPELRLWRHLSNSQLGGFKFRRQHAVEGRVLDFFCPAIAICIEIDGHTHDADDDRLADDYLLQRTGIVTLRFNNVDVMTNLDGVLQMILTCAQKLPLRWPSRGVLHPNPSSEEEGLSS
ncbi:endonuclease domain-containing protein [Sphingomonas corticis]|jgi:very-short-patch-repair endonuclease|uniref:DUF559 domain-containing protein n=1 Tax=Sphingomonas corticis TaxID=2722791 RepID=A0ABX1CQ94_9SPHN|nr:DUF559 domain-containing protein [Sphingomonas corticis]NJR79001.1 DUF559 domain-containing protein [Sphingomonas corticis]